MFTAIMICGGMVAALVVIGGVIAAVLCERKYRRICDERGE